jgi:hypothetical protein
MISFKETSLSMKNFTNWLMAIGFIAQPFMMNAEYGALQERKKWQEEIDKERKGDCYTLGGTWNQKTRSCNMQKK